MSTGKDLLKEDEKPRGNGNGELFPINKILKVKPETEESRAPQTEETSIKDEAVEGKAIEGEAVKGEEETVQDRAESEETPSPEGGESEDVKDPLDLDYPEETEMEDNALLDNYDDQRQEVDGPSETEIFGEFADEIEVSLGIEDENNPAGDELPEPVLNENSVTVLKRRYLKKDEEGNVIETPKEMFLRVAENIASAEFNYDPEADTDSLARDFYNLMAPLNFLPNSPTLMNAGRELQQLSACFVLPVEDSMESIFEAVKHTALIHKSGGGTGFSFSRLRPQSDRVKSTKGVSSGPISFMTVFDAATETIKQGGTRRGANMGILRVDHPDIVDFIHCKQETKKLNNFNISVALTEEFMKALKEEEYYELKSPRTGEPVGKEKSTEIFDQIVEMAWKNGEPGIIFLDRLNQDNPTPNVGEIESTNPCGEQPLLPYESCNLGSINLSNMIKGGNGSMEAAEIDYDKLGRVTDEAVHFLDNVIDMNDYPLPEIEEKTKGNRKIGLGVMGFAEMLIKLDIPYNSIEALKTAEDVMSFIRERAREHSIKLAMDRGSFPNFYGSTWEKDGYRMMRNATATTIAPTGTLSIIANTSSGIEPLFALSFIRNVMDDDELVEVNELFEKRAKEGGFYSEELMHEVAEKGSLKEIDGIPDDVKRVFVTAHDITPEWHIRMQAAFQKFTDNAVSKTVNFPEHATEDDIRKVYELAYDLGCKGVTVYRDKSRDAQVLNIGEVNRESGEISDNDLMDVVQVEIHREVPAKPRARARVMWGTTRKMKTGCGDLYVTINEDEEGLFEVFAQMGKAGGCSASQNETTGRLISLALRSGLDVNSVIKQLSGIRCPSPIFDHGSQILSCSDAISKALREYIEETDNPNINGSPVPEMNSGPMIATCPDCGAAVVHESGCVTCTSCGFSKC